MAKPLSHVRIRQSRQRQRQGLFRANERVQSASGRHQPQGRFRMHLRLTLLTAVVLLYPLQAAAGPAEFRRIAHEYYQWHDAAYPVATSAAGDHHLDNRLTDYTMTEVLRRRQHVSDLLTLVDSLAIYGWSKDDPIDVVLFRAELAGADFFGRRLNPEASDPQQYVNECTNSIFTLLQKYYAPHRTRSLAATARLEQIPALLRTGRANLMQPVSSNASLASQAARGGDDLY